MTVATALETPPLSLASAGSSCEPLFPLSSSGQQLEFSITVPTGAMSFDWSDFPLVSQYHQDMPAPAASVSSPIYFSATRPATSSSKTSASCSLTDVPALSWEIDDDDTTSFSVSSDDETDATFPSGDDSSSSSNNANSRTNNKRDSQNSKHSVKFSSVLEIRSHAVVLGDHPCSSGLALELGWEPQDLEVVDFDLYESSRQFQRRSMAELRLTYWERRRLLEQSTGLCEQELLLQEQRAWREHHWPSIIKPSSESTNNHKKDKTPAPPQKSCCCYDSSCATCTTTTTCSVLRKVASTKTLSAMITASSSF